MKKFFGIAAIGVAIAACSVQTARAQYPRVPPAMQAKTDSAMAVEKHRSDMAWENALPAIEKDEKNGKPYVPWAAKPSDLPQAKI
ncbi:MAG: polysaccharide lyase, partial [Bacteroidetes bacterium]|nr:polysaccharide lyase [Bacteroidota bacterium]